MGKDRKLGLGQEDELAPKARSSPTPRFLGQFDDQSRQISEPGFQEMSVFRVGPQSAGWGHRNPAPLGEEGRRRRRPVGLVRVSGSKAGLISDINWEDVAGVRRLRFRGA